MVQFTGGTSTSPLKPGLPLALLGGGTFQFSAGWLDLTNDIIPNLQLYGGIYGGTYLELEPTFQGGAITNLALNGIILTNLTLAVSNGVFAVTNSPVYGKVVVQKGGQLIAAGAPGQPTFHGNLDLKSGGVLTAASGWLAIPSDGALTVEAGGELDIFGSAYLELDGPMTNAGAVNLLGNYGGESEIYVHNNGSGNYLGSLWNQPGGTIQLNGMNNGYSVIGSGGAGSWFLNEGAVVVSPGSPPCQIGPAIFTNAGAVSVSRGTLVLNPGSLMLQPSGSLNVQLNSLSDYGKISVNGAAMLNGAFGASLYGSYRPGAGDSFQPLTYSSYTGAFTATNLPGLAAWQTSYGTTALTLAVEQTGFIPAITTAALSGGNFIFKGTNGAPGGRYWVLSSTNVAAPRSQWRPVATNYFDAAGRFSFTNALDAADPRRFFTLELQ
jgi:hypothetical protein